MHCLIKETKLNSSYTKECNNIEPIDFQYKRVLEDWLENKEDIDTVIWTNLPSEFNGEFTEDTVINFLQRLIDKHIADDAEEYIRKAPAIIDTPIRKAIEKRLKWNPKP